MGMTEISTIISAAGASLTVVLVNFFAWKGKNRFLDLKRMMSQIDAENGKDHTILHKKLDEIAGIFSTEKQLILIANDSKDYVREDDHAMLLFISTCIDVTINFYKELTAGSLDKKTHDDILRASNKAISIVATASKKFEPEYWAIVSKKFGENAMNVRNEIIGIIEDEHNRTKERFVLAIQKYLSDQLIYVTKERIKFLK